jgi:NAD+ synthase (glutamine-hydrolysing)
MSARSFEFASLYSHGYCRVAACTPRVDVANPRRNAEFTLELARQAAGRQAILAVFPELGLAGYTSDDLFFQDAVLDAVEDGLEAIREASCELETILLVGAPLRAENKLFNCAVALHRGEILGVVPKLYLPNYREFYEKRYFSSGLEAVGRTIRLLGREAPFGSDLVFEATGIPGFSLHVEICEDLWPPVAPSSYGALAGATVLANLSASNITVGKAEYRRLICAAQSGKCIAAYVYTGAGPGESTNDLAWDGHALIYENGELHAESERFPTGPGLIAADIDLERLRQDRARTTSFNDCVQANRERLAAMRRIAVPLEPPAGIVPLERRVDRFPFVPANPATRDERCAEVYAIQVQGLAKRLQATGIRRAVIGVSGGLDSTQALIVCAKAFDRLGLPRSDILAYTMPGFATSKRTRDNAWKLMKALGVAAAEIDIRPSATQMLKDIGHPYDRGEPVYDVTFENVQAGERTSHLFRLANQNNGIVVGTGDLSELALGWSTYGVGDQMSHYNVNASVPKTLIQHLLRWAIETKQFDPKTGAVLQSIVDTEISPELVPGKEGDDPAQSSEATVGPYPLQDFHLYYLSRFGYRPSKVAFLALHAWGDRNRGQWPASLPETKRLEFDLPTIKKWLTVFVTRFFALSQFKRTAMPNGPKVGSGGSLSPRGDWRAPSDVSAAAWLEELERNVP